MRYSGQLNPLILPFCHQQQESQRHSVVHVPPEARPENTPVRTPEDSTPPVPKAENGTPVAKPEGPKMVRDGGEGSDGGLLSCLPGYRPLR